MERGPGHDHQPQAEVNQDYEFSDYVPKEFSRKTNLKTKALEVNTVKLSICPQQLAVNSPVFETMLLGTDSDKSEKEIAPIRGARNLEDFILFLQFLTTGSLGPKEKISGRYLEILKLADEFQTDCVKNAVFRHIVEVWKPTPAQVRDQDQMILDFLVLAYQYKNQEGVTALFDRVRDLHWYYGVMSKLREKAPEVWNLYQEFQAEQAKPPDCSAKQRSHVYELTRFEEVQSASRICRGLCGYQSYVVACKKCRAVACIHCPSGILTDCLPPKRNSCPYGTDCRCRKCESSEVLKKVASLFSG